MDCDLWVNVLFILFFSRNGVRQMDVQNYIIENSYFPLHKTHFKTQKLFKEFNRGIVSYEESGEVYVVAGDPVCSVKKNIPLVLDQFVRWAHSQGKYVCGYYFSEFVASQSKLLTSYQAGTTLENKLDEFSLSGKSSSEIRRALNYGERNNLLFKELSDKEYFEIFFELKYLESVWLRSRKSFKQIKFLLSSIKINSDQISDRNFVVFDDNYKAIAFVSLDSFLEADGRKSYYLDHMLIGKSGYSLSLDYLIAKVLLTLKGEGKNKLDLGFCPFRGVKPTGFIEGSLYFSRHLKYLYNSNGIYNYKKKFSNNEKQVFLMLDPGYPNWKQLFRLATVTFR